MPEYQNKYVTDILLKRPNETFVDDPSSLSEINVAELVFDLEHNIKDINSLHLLHAVAILRQVVEDLMALGADPALHAVFRKNQLSHNSIDLDELEHQQREANEQARGERKGQASDRWDGSSDGQVEYEGHGEAQSEGGHGEAHSEGGHGEAQSEGGHGEARNEEEPKGHSKAYGDAEDANVGNGNQKIQGVQDGEIRPSYRHAHPQQNDSHHPKPESHPHIHMQTLLQASRSETAPPPISKLCTERLRKEVVFHMQPQVQKQAVHLVRNFSLAKAPPISIEEFLVRIHTYSPSISVAVYIHSAYMLYKLCVVLGVVTLTPHNVHRFLLASLRCSTKKLEDVYQKQKSFAMVGGLALRDLCRIEVSFLYLFNFQVIVSEALLNDFLASGVVALHATVSGAESASLSQGVN